MKECMICGAPVIGPAIRFRHGFMTYTGEAPGFSHEAMEDGSYAKWAHPPCLPEVSAGCLDQDWCRLCEDQFFWEEEPRESLLFVEEGTLEITIEGNPQFDVVSGGLGHFLCVCEDWDVPLWRIHGDPP